MENWRILYAFIYPHEAHLVRTKLESEGIEVLMRDEETIQAINLYSDALGGVRLEVQHKDYVIAKDILKEMGYVLEQKSKMPFMVKKVHQFTGHIPLLNKTIIEIRFLILLFFLVSIFVILLIYFIA